MFRKTKSILLPRPTVFSAVFLTAYGKMYEKYGKILLALKVVLYDISINEYSNTVSWISHEFRPLKFILL